MTAVIGLTYALSIALWVFTSAYALLASREFIAQQFLQPELLPPLATFARHWGAVAACTLALWLAPRRTLLRQRDLSTSLATAFWAAAIGVDWLVAPLVSMPPGAGALCVASAALLMTLPLAAAERPSVGYAIEQSSLRTTSDFLGCLLAGAAMSGIEILVAFLRGTALGGLAIVVEIRIQLLAAMAVFLVLTIIRGVAGLLARPVAVESRLALAVLGTAFGWFIGRVVLPSIGLVGGAATAAAYLAGVVLAVALTARTPASGQIEDGVASVVRAFAPRFVSRRIGFAAWLIVAAAIAYGFDRASHAGDWNFVLSRGGVFVVWILTIAGAVRAVRIPEREAPPTIFLASAVLVLGAHAGMERLAVAPFDVRPATPTARWVADLLAAREEGPSELYELLPAHTNVPASAGARPVDVRWADLNGPVAPERPNIFLFVVDSLRRDYLAPYNPRVDFTPAIGAFANENLVFTRAFTQYGGTGLSVPSIWIGGSLLHEQYVTPFASMNALSKLLVHEQYAQWISMDNILDVTLPRTPALDPLDRGVSIKDFRMCRTLDEVRRRLRGRPAGAPPVFVYSLPQDVHVSVIAREGTTSVDDGSYEGFYAPVASRVRRFDACFGEFLADLKAQGQYDRSVIVLTSDHGDSLGEEGRMGHAYTLYPEVARVPLIVHVPATVRDRYLWDLRRAAYTTDLTPTLYRLLGHDPVSPGLFYGTSLARPNSAEAPASADRMIAASYGSVYGAVLDEGARLYVVDAIERREMMFELGDGPDPGARVPVDPATRRAGGTLIFRTVESIARAYRYAASARR
jgi:hypothetical protein